MSRVEGYLVQRLFSVTVARPGASVEALIVVLGGLWGRQWSVECRRTRPQRSINGVRYGSALKIRPAYPRSKTPRARAARTAMWGL